MFHKISMDTYHQQRLGMPGAGGSVYTMIVLLLLASLGAAAAVEVARAHVSRVEEIWSDESERRVQSRRRFLLSSPPLTTPASPPFLNVPPPTPASPRSWIATIMKLDDGGNRSAAARVLLFAVPAAVVLRPWGKDRELVASVSLLYLFAAVIYTVLFVIRWVREKLELGSGSGSRSGRLSDTESEAEEGETGSEREGGEGVGRRLSDTESEIEGNGSGRESAEETGTRLSDTESDMEGEVSERDAAEGTGGSQSDNTESETEGEESSSNWE